jgi:lipopolysaccharide/colanic/teichoic acid biosynthesis glycosyltransferase
MVHAENVKAVIAAGGLKSRAIRPINISATFFPLLNRPAILNTLDTLGAAGVSEVFLSVGRGEVELAALPESSNGLVLHTVIEERPRGTAGCVKRLERRLCGDALILVTGDVLYFTEQDLCEMLLFHRRSGADMTVGLISALKKNGVDTEKVLVGSDDRIESISRIYPSVPRNGGPKTSGLYIMEPGVLQSVGESGFCDVKEQLIPRLGALGKKVLGWTHRGYSSGARTLEDYLRVNFELLGDASFVRERLGGYREIKKHVWVGRDVEISPSATLVRPLIIGSESRIGAGASLVGPSIIGDRCALGQGSFVRESVLWPDSSAPADFEIEKCLISGRATSLENSHCRDKIVINGPVALGGAGARRPGQSRRKASPGIAPAPAGGGRAYLTAKRAIDVIVSAVSLVLSAPMFFLLGALIKLDSRGPVFFRQTRCGEGGKPFEMIKLRSMIEGAEELKPSLEHLNLADGPMFKLLDDPRETRIGRILRASKLDELPQLLNVLRGEMSLVGPRPLSMDEMRCNPHWRDARLMVRPGVTGLWQIKEKDAHTFHEWIEYDLQYVDERSLWFDLKILAATPFKVFDIQRSE